MTHDGTKTYGYDYSNRMLTAGSAGLGYDPSGRLYTVASGGVTTRFLYDGADLIAEYNAAGAVVRRYVHGPGIDEPLVWYEGSGTSDRRHLYADERGSIVAVEGASTTKNTYDDYGAPGAGNAGRFQYTGQIWLSDVGLYYYKARAYSPDLGRFMQTDPIGYGDGMSYNPAGQIVSRSPSNASYLYAPPASYADSYTSNGLNQYTAARGATPTYTDARGNMTYDGAKTYGYDYSNRLVSASGSPGATLSYDPLGRLYQVAASSTYRFVYDGADVIAEYDSSGNVLRRYVHGPGLDEPLVWFEGAGHSGSGAPDRRHLYADERGSIVAIEGGSVSINKYDSYGVPASSNTGRFQYTAQMWLPEAGLYHYKARAYSPQLGRFMQTDPIGYGDGMNLYNYVGGDPVNRIDPFGTFEVIPCPGREDCWIQLDDHGCNEQCERAIAKMQDNAFWSIFGFWFAGPAVIAQDIGETAHGPICQGTAAPARILRSLPPAAGRRDQPGSKTSGFYKGYAYGVGGGGGVGVWYSDQTNEYGYYFTGSVYVGVLKATGGTGGLSNSNNPTGVALVGGLNTPIVSAEMSLSAEKGEPILSAGLSERSDDIAGYVGGSATWAPSCGSLN